MKCANCDAEIKDGSIYCPVCGKEAQMVNGYASLEDDFLHSLLREEIKPLTKNSKKELTPEEKLKIQKYKQAMPVIVTGLILAIMISVGVLIKVLVDHKNNNSYEFQMKKAQMELVDHNYESALGYFSRALALVPNDVQSRMEMADIYLIQEKTENAVILLTEVIRLDDEYAEAYQKLIDIYVEKEQYDQLKILAEYTSEEEIQQLFEDYLVEKPEIFPVGGIYYDKVHVTISSEGRSAIYYTTDGTDPAINGKRYIDGMGIWLEESGFYTIRAVSKSRKNIYSDMETSSYQILFLTEETEETTVDPYQEE